MEWKDERPAGARLIAGALLDRPLAEMCDKARLLDLIRNFIIFDERPQEGAAPASVRRREGGAGAHPPSARAASSGTPRAAARAS